MDFFTGALDTFFLHKLFFKAHGVPSHHHLMGTKKDHPFVNIEIKPISLVTNIDYLIFYCFVLDLFEISSLFFFNTTFIVCRFCVC